MTKIYLSPSSQWGNTYSYGKHNEAEICGQIAKYAAIALERNGYEVKVGNNDDWGMAERTKESNNWGADFHIPIHTNAGGGEGTVVFASSVSANNKYVKEVYNALAEVSPGKDRNVRVNDGLYEVNMTTAVCIYTETEFHDDAKLAEWIVKNVEVIGEAIAKGFCNADGKTYKSASETVNKEPIKEETPKQEKLYRVRKSANDAKTQKGAFKNLDGAKKTADENPGYSVFDENLKCIYVGKNNGSFMVRVKIEDLNIRTGAGTGYGRVGFIEPGTYTIIETKESCSFIEI